MSITWTEHPNYGPYGWKSITSDSTGTKLAAVVQDGDIWTSNNSGANWTQNIVGGG